MEKLYVYIFAECMHGHRKAIRKQESITTELYTQTLEKVVIK